MRNIILMLVLGLMLSCKQTITDADLQNLNGYWEIEKVNLPDGDKKEYKINETIDFFKLQSKKGFRNNVQEDFIIKVENGTAIIQYKTKYASWNEEIIELSSDKLVVKNQQDLKYQYKRPVKFSIK